MANIVERDESAQPKGAKFPEVFVMKDNKTLDQAVRSQLRLVLLRHTLQFTKRYFQEPNPEEQVRAMSKKARTPIPLPDNVATSANRLTNEEFETVMEKFEQLTGYTVERDESAQPKGAKFEFQRKLNGGFYQLSFRGGCSFPASSSLYLYLLSSLLSPQFCHLSFLFPPFSRPVLFFPFTTQMSRL